MKKIALLVMTIFTVVTSFAAPYIGYSTLGPDCSNANRTLANVTISDITGVPTSGAFVPRIYYRKSSSSTWYSQPGTLMSGTANFGTWDFVIVSSNMGTLSNGDVVQYYVVAQSADATPLISSLPAGVNASTVNSVTTPPSAPNTYTIGASMGGTYTVGAGGNYATLAAAFSAYSSAGCITSPITFSLTDAVYTVNSQLVIESAAATSSGTLTIKPANGMNVTINGTVALDLFRIKGSFVTIDGNNGVADKQLTINNLSTAQPRVFGIFSTGTNMISDVTIQNAILNNGSQSYNAIHIADVNNQGGIGYFKNIRIINNTITRAYCGVMAFMSTGAGYGLGLKITNNDLAQTGASAIRNMGIYVMGSDGAVISDNTIGNFSGSTDENDAGIVLDNGARNTIVERNRINNLSYTGNSGWGAQGIYVNTAITAAGIRIANNFISNISGDGGAASNANPVGIYLLGSQSGIEIYHNSISLSGNRLYWTSAFSAGIYLSSGSSASIVNNIISNNMGQDAGAPTGSVAPYGAAGIIASSMSQLASVSNNVYWVAPAGLGAKSIARIGSNSYTTLSTWQTASAEPNAKNVQPVFVSASDLHLVGASNASISDGGLPIGVTTDIDNQTRSVSAPDPGADEFAGTCVAPQISSQPAAVAACVGSAINLSVTATGSGLSFQWRRNGTNIAGATSASFSIPSAATSDASNYDVVVTGTCGSITSASVAVTVNAVTAISTQPVAQTVCPGSNATLSVVASGAALAYQWRLNGTAITGATQSNLIITNISGAQSGNYDVTVTGTCGSVTSSVAALTLVSNATIATQPVSKTVCNGTATSFSVTASGGGITYQWRKNGTPITGATTSTLNFTNSSASDAGNYDVVITNSCGNSVTSAQVSLTVNPATAITTQPQSQSVCAGSVVAFNVIATGANLTYQWKKNGVDIVNAVSQGFGFTSYATTDAGNYSVVVTGSCGSVTSSVATLSTAASTAITTQPQSQSVCLGANATISVAATGNNLTYQWFKNGVLMTGANSSSINLNNINATDIASYTVTVTGCNAVSSSAAVISTPSGNTWLGAVSSNWNAPGNWCGGIPSSTSDVTINSGTTFAPVVSTLASVHNITIGAGASLAVDASGQLNIFGNVVNNGTFTATAGALAFTGTAMQTINTPFAVNNLVMSGAGITPGGNITVGGQLTLTNGNINLGNNQLSLTSSAPGSAASHIITGGTGSVMANNVNATAVMIPVGATATSYNPVTIANGGGMNYKVQVATGINPAIAIPNMGVNRTWTVTPSATPASPVSITLQFADADGNSGMTATSAMEAGVHNGSNWMVVTPQGGILPSGTATDRKISFTTTQFGAMVVSSPGGFTYITSVPTAGRIHFEMQLIPTMVANIATIKLHTERSSQVNFTITDMLGRIVLTMKREASRGSNHFPVDLSSLSAGTYLMNMETPTHEKAVVRFIRY